MLTAVVPCDGCRLCCLGDAVRLTADDNPSKYQTEPHPAIPGALMLAHKPNGDCIYLGPTGCENHADRPTLCRAMDCRNIAKMLSFTEARKLNQRGMVPIHIWNRGRELLRLDINSRLSRD